MLSKWNKHIIWKREHTILSLCMVIAFFSWIIMKMSTEHTITIPVLIQYEIPESMTFESDPGNKFDLTIRGYGWDLLKARPTSKSALLKVSLTEELKHTINESRIKNEIRVQLTDDRIKIIDVNPNSMEIALTPTYQKKVPVIADLQIDFFPDHDLSSPIKILPDSITIYGPQQLLDSITSWKTEPILFKKIKNDVQRTVKLVSPSNIFIRMSTSSVLIEATVEEFTEKMFELPVQLIGLDGRTVRTNEYRLLPESAKVFFVLPLSKYETPLKEEFKLVASLDLMQIKRGENIIPLDLKFYPNYIKSYKIAPNYIELFKVEN
jgi:hypothetical protein